MNRIIGPGFVSGFGFVGFGAGPFFNPFFPDAFFFDPFLFNPFFLDPFFFNQNLAFFGSFSPCCDPFGFNGYYPYGYGGYDTNAAGLDNTYDQPLTPLQSSVYISNGTLPGLTPVSPENASATSQSSAAAGASTSPDVIDASSRPPAQVQAFGGQQMQNNPANETLVFTDGATVVVSQCWLGDDWQLHYVTVSGEQKTVPLDRLDLQGTATANNQRGVPFLLPLSPKQQPDQSNLQRQH